MTRDRWEYCYVYSGAKEVYFYTVDGEQKTKVKDYRKAIAELGVQGWELATSDATANCLYFKRRIE